MKIYKSNRNYNFIDKELFDYINNIWLTYDITIPNDSNIYFSKNTTINRMITDYADKDIRRVIKTIKADYIIINKFELDSYPQYIDLATMNITEDDTKEPVYAIYNLSTENQLTIEMILELIEREQEVKYVNQSKLNETLNNGFVVDKNNFTTIQELVNSDYSDNHNLAVSMLVNSDLKSNWEWILYLFSNKIHHLNTYDKKGVIRGYFQSLNFKYNWDQLFNNRNVFFEVVKDDYVLDTMENKMRQELKNKIQKLVDDALGTNKLTVEDFKLKYRHDS